MSNIQGFPQNAHINQAYVAPNNAPVQNQPQAAPRDVKSNDRMLSGAELVARMGAEPKANLTLFGKTLHTNSAEYKSALAHLETYNDHAGSMGTIGSFTDTKVQTLKQDLRAVIADADAYIAKHGGDSDKADRRGVMGEVKRMAEAELANLDGFSKLKGQALNGLSVADGLALLRGGVQSDTRVSTALNDAGIDAGRSKDNFGSGKMNTVSLIAYGNDMRVVKPIVGQKKFEQLAFAEKAIGIDPKDLNLAARNIASANVAAAMGCAAMIPQVDVVVHHGEAALAMQLAPGESLVHKHDEPIQDTAVTTALDNGTQFPNAKQHKDNNGVWVEVQTDYRAIPYNDTSKAALSAEVKRGLLDLQVLDCLVGQMDRQPENIFVQINNGHAQIIGIDNDMCMGRGLVHVDKIRVMGEGPEMPLTPDLTSNYGGPPPLMSRDMADRLGAMSVDNFKALLGDDFSQGEVDAAVGRFNDMKQHASDLDGNGRVVDNFETWTGTDAGGGTVGAHDFLMGASERSYYARDITTQGARTQHTPLDPSKH